MSDDELSTSPSAPPSREDAAAVVAAAGRAAAEAAGFVCKVERSPGSESTYLHTLRDGVWYGVRISCHEPAHDCSKDYEQLRLADLPDAAAVNAASQTAAERVVAGGEVVADPDEVAVAVAKIADVMADGRVYRDADGTRWRWSTDDQAWRQVGRYWGDAPPSPPTHRPNPQVSARIRCQVRHSQNVAARWAAEQAST